MENEGDDKKSIWHSLLIGSGLLLAGGVLSALSGDTYGNDDLTNGQKLDLRETAESCQWEFDDEIEYASVSDDTVWFTLEEGTAKAQHSPIPAAFGLDRIGVITKPFRMPWIPSCHI